MIHKIKLQIDYDLIDYDKEAYIDTTRHCDFEPSEVMTYLSAHDYEEFCREELDEFIKTLIKDLKDPTMFDYLFDDELVNYLQSASELKLKNIFDDDTTIYLEIECPERYKDDKKFIDLLNYSIVDFVKLTNDDIIEGEALFEDDFREFYGKYELQFNIKLV